jgi:dephospho-CoA kinase
MIVGITGNIAAGKSTVCSMIREEFGVHAITADKVGHDILENNPKVKHDLVNSFGAQILNDDGSISRRKLGNLVFNDSNAMDFLNNTIWPYLLYEVDEQLQRSKRLYQMLILDAALIFEWNARNRVNVVVTVYADDEIRIKRLMRNQRLDEIEARLRIASQMPQEEKKKQADYTIPNNKTLDVLREKTFEVWTQILKKAD